MRFKSILIFLVIILFPLFLLGQGPGQGRGPNPCPPNNPNCVPDRVPITEGTVFLLLAAFGIGIKSFSRKKKS